MQIKAWKYIHGDTRVGNTHIISALDRDKHMTGQYMAMFSEFIDGVELVGEQAALLYAGGPGLHHSDLRNVKDLAPKENIVIKSQMGNNTYQIAKRIGNINYISSNVNTCASSVYAIREALHLIRDGATDVIVYAEEMIDETLELLFKQLQIKLICGDGACMMHFTNEGQSPQITGSKWIWNEEKSPMSVSEEGYSKLFEGQLGLDFVKVHGSGTIGNDIAEDNAVAKNFPGCEVLKYKQHIGHTQGASALIELGLLLDSGITGSGIVVASGLGGVYGSINITI